MFGMMLIGMGLFRLGVLTLERRTGLYLAMMLGGYAVGLATNAWETRHIIDGGFSALAFTEVTTTYDLGRLAHDLRPSRRCCCCSSAAAFCARSGAPSPRSAGWRSPII